MSRFFRRVGTRAAAENSDYEFEAPLTEKPSERRLNADPAQVAMGVLLDRMLGDAGLTINNAGRDGDVVVLVVPASEWTRVALDAWTSTVRTGERSQSGHLDIYLVGVDLQARAVSTESGHAYNFELQDGPELAPVLLDHLGYALHTWGFTDVAP